MPPIGKSHLETICRKHYGAHKSCNFFVRDVAKALSEPVPDGKADDIVATGTTTWHRLTADQASWAAKEGYMVIAGMSSSELHENHGHVAVVLPGTLHGFPRVCSTNEGDGHFGKSQGETPMTQIFPARSVRQDKVHYFVHPSLGLELKLLWERVKHAVHH